MTWTTFETSIDDKAALILLDDRFADQAPIGGLDDLCWVGLWCQKPPGQHFWDPSETQLLDKIESELITIAGELGHGWAVYVLRICTPGIREYYLYAGQHAELSTLHQRLRELNPAYRIEFSKKKDERWAFYRGFLERRKSSSGSAPGLVP